ncbi:MAG: tRNA adenosine(34) deaminase TadA [Hahellaceae bacterium]|nr:tRNA adenosine(34) deaminase TadA [Hahellaceae bacterium]MCP5212008.1 tRNA adenosine(34) deaminase TadA [Hahellaceae bacterium]
MLENESDEQWMRRAIVMAQNAYAAGEVPIGAVIVRDEQVLGEGFNFPIGACDPTAHAEIQALRMAAKAAGNYRLPGCTLYVTVEPCTMCAGALVHARISRLVFGAREGKAGAVVSKVNVINHEAMNHKLEVTGGILEHDCAALMSSFFAERRNKKKQAGVDFNAGSTDH